MASRAPLTLIPALALALPASAQFWPEPLRTAADAPETRPAYAYDLMIEVAGQTARARIDPSAPEGERLTVLSPPESERGEKLNELVMNIANNLDGQIGCARMLDMVPGSVELLSEDEEAATYGFTPQPLPEMDGQQRKLMTRLEGQITVSKSQPDVLAYSMTLPKPYKPAIVAKIDTFQMEVSCAPGPEGRQISARRVMEISGSALGNPFGDREVYTISNAVRVDAPETALATAR